MLSEKLYRLSVRARAVRSRPVRDEHGRLVNPESFFDGCGLPQTLAAFGDEDYSPPEKSS